MSEHPTPTGGAVTLLLADIEGGSKMWERDPASMRAAHSRYDAILREVTQANGGYAYKLTGDTCQAAFSTPAQALQAAIDAQLLLFTEEWPFSIGEIRVRMAIHTGVVEERTGDYFGPMLHRLEGLLSAAYGGQVLISSATQELVRDALPNLRPSEPQAVQLRDLGEHRLKDLTRPEQIYQLVVPSLPTLPSQFPPPRTLDSRPNNLPLQLTSLVGREKQVTDVCALLRRPDVRMVTITGTGGTGKTRLSLQVGAETLGEFSDGVWFVDLSPLADYTLVAPTIAQALSVGEAPGRPLIDTLKEYLSDKQLLLILDNFEQIMAASPAVGAIVKAAPGVKALVTSRIKLNIYGEREYALPPLSLHPLLGSQAGTDQGAATAQVGQAQFRNLPLDKVTQCEAVRLFTERAQASKADFEVTSDNCAAVAEICVRLDGLPLAIELAAARVKMLPPQALVTRLSSRLKILTGGSRDLPARQQTLRGAIEWSYELLGEDERQLFRRMAPFSGGRSLEALEAVCNCDGQLEIDVLDGVQSLLDKSLLQQRDAADGEPRFWMLETIREYALERLMESDEAEVIRRRHAEYFLELAEEGAAKQRGREQVPWLDKVESELDNMRSALEWARASAARPGGGQDALEANEIALRMAWALRLFWQARGYVTEARESLASVLASDRSGRTALRARALGVAGWLAFQQGDYETAKPMYEESLDIRRELGDTPGEAHALDGLGHIANEQGDCEAAQGYYSRSLEINRKLGLAQSTGSALNNLGIVATRRGDYLDAQSLLEQALTIFKQLGHKQAVATALGNLGDVAQRRKDYKAARSIYEEGLAIAREVGDRHGIAQLLSNLAGVSWHLGEYSNATSYYNESLAMCREFGDKRGIVECLEGMARMAGSEGKRDRCARLWGAAEALRSAIGAPVPPAELADHEQAMESARTLVGAEQFERMRAEGQKLSMDEAVDFALGAGDAEAAKGVREPDEFRVEIDKDKKARQVAAITDTDYFRELQNRARSLRQEAHNRG